MQINIKQVRLDLEARLQELTGKVRQGTQQLREVSATMRTVNDSDIDDLDSGENTTEFLGVRTRAIEEVEAALARIDEGKYGICLECEEPISPQRLMAINTAILCIDCRREEERRESGSAPMSAFAAAMESDPEDE